MVYCANNVALCTAANAAGTLSLNGGSISSTAGNTANISTVATGGAGFVLTPECTNALSSNRAQQRQMLRAEGDDPTLAALRDEASRAGIWLLIGSLGVLTDDADGRFANRSFLIGPDGGIAARVGIGPDMQHHIGVIPLNL